jgi:VCBS repeat-containing protein
MIPMQMQAQLQQSPVLQPTTASGSAQTTFSSSSETVTGQYGTLTINSNGSYSYAANSNISGLDAGDANITDVFTYIVSDGTATSTATLTINVIASQDLTARNDTGTVNEDATLTVANSSNATTVSAASLVQSKSVSGAGSTRFNNDGTKMFVLRDYSYDDIQEWTLTTPHDVSTASLVDSFDISSQHTDATGFKFNGDGTKFYIVGGNYSGMYEYDLSTAYDISTSSYNTSYALRRGTIGSNLSLSQPKGIDFSSDGTKFFAVNSNDRKVYEYSLSTAFDPATASVSTTYPSGQVGIISNTSFSFGSETANPRDITFNSDGTRMIVTGTTNGITGKLYEYKLTTAFDISTASYYSNFDVASDPKGISFNNDGTKMFIPTAGTVREYSLTSPFTIGDVNGEHSGDVIDTSSTDNYDTDPDSDTLTITSIIATTAGGNAQTTFSSNTEAVTGSYGILTINSNGSYQYAATLDATDALDAGDVVTDVFTYIVSDGQGETDTATITITVIGVNDAPSAQNDVGVIVEDGTLTVSNGANANLSGSYDATGEHSGDIIDTSSSSHTDSDADDSASLTVTAIRVGSSEGSGTAGSIGSALTGTYGQLTIAADGSYSYVANQDAADALDVGDSVTDSFNYTLSDGTATDIGVITITILGANDNPTAVNDTGYIKEGGTLTVANSAAASSGTSTGNHTGDMTDNDTDADASSTATITSITATTASGSAQTTFSSSSETGYRSVRYFNN